MTDQTPPEKPTSAFEALLADPLEQFDKRSDLLSSIDAYSKAVPATASAQQPQSKAVVLYTAAEVKVLTETASKVAYALGRKDALDEMTSKCEEGAERLAAEAATRSGHASWKLIGTSRGYKLSAEVARNLASQPSQAASDATSGVPGHPEVSEAARSPQEPCDDCAEGIAHQHPNGELVACRERCPGCVYCPRGEDQE